MNLLVAVLVVGLLIPILAATRPGPIGEQLAAWASLSTKAAVLMLVVGVQRADPMLVQVGVTVLAVGNGGLVLLVRLLREDSR
ncbi:hypothetical protein KBY88_03550 [Cyanobium sp. Morenito 9A2]|nr:hypothetical protein [Cyanobium sp. Morenito 9A2]